MIDHLSYSEDTLYVHLAGISMKATKAFTHGRVVFDEESHLATFGPLAVPFPENLTLSDGAEVAMCLVGPNGAPRKQTREIVLRVDSKRAGIYSAPGLAKSPRKFTAEEGWRIEVFKYRAYFSHPGLRTDSHIPVWLSESIARQKAFWNRLAWLCREARRKCSPVPVELIRGFVNETILPRIDDFNRCLGPSKDRIRHPARLKSEEPGVDALWGFINRLRTRIEKRHSLPDGLLDECVAFAQQFRVDYAPINDFLVRFPSAAREESAKLGLCWYESEQVIQAFNAVLKGRKSKHASFSDGWPAINYADRPHFDEWNLHYPMKTSPIAVEDLDYGPGIPGLRFGPALPTNATGHPTQIGTARLRRLREADISIRGGNRQVRVFRFGVLQHRSLPPGSHLKAWRLVYKEKALWLCLTVEVQRPVSIPSSPTAGLDIGWRRTEAGIRFGVLYEPNSKSFVNLTMNFQLPPRNQTDRVPFRMDLGPTRWERRNISTLLPGWSIGDDPVPGAFELRGAVQSRIESQMQKVRILLKQRLGGRFPAWGDKAGRKGLLKMADEFRDDMKVGEITAEWCREDAMVLASYRLLCRKITQRIEDGHYEVAHDICRFLRNKNIGRLIVEARFLARVTQQRNGYVHESLKRSQKYRQFVAVGKFVMILRHTATKYGIVVEQIEATNTTRICQHCNHLNPSTNLEAYQCESCGVVVDQDQNAAVNLSRFAEDPSLLDAAQRSALGH